MSYNTRASLFLKLVTTNTIQVNKSSFSTFKFVKSFHTFNALQTQQEVREPWSKTLADTTSSKFQDRFYISNDHPIVTRSQLEGVEISHLKPKSISDKIALTLLKIVRRSFDFFTGYKHDSKKPMTETQWLRRFIFLESVAGVPGMVAGLVRHLHSLRLMRRDKAWIGTLLEEAYNERMHLMVFLQLANPGIVMKIMLLGAQGVFFNLFFAAYLVVPKACHRFVGYLEEEAVVTYTRCIQEITEGKLPAWKALPPPDIAIKYWHMDPNSTIEDLIYYVRADEAKHREVNHTFGNLEQTQDRNPYAVRVVDEKNTPQPTVDLSVSKPTGWERQEIAA